MGPGRVVDLLAERPNVGRGPEGIRRLRHHLRGDHKVVAEHVKRPLKGSAEWPVRERLEPRRFPGGRLVKLRRQRLALRDLLWRQPPSRSGGLRARGCGGQGSQKKCGNRDTVHVLSLEEGLIIAFALLNLS